MSRPLSLLVCRCLTLCAIAASPPLHAEAEKQFTITNPLKLDFPWELVHRDFPPGEISGDVSMQVGDELRPAQTELIEEEGNKMTRVWFIASLRGGNEADLTKEAVLKPGATESALSVTIEGANLVVANGIYEFRVPNYAGAFPAPQRIKEMTPVVGGVRVAGADHWYGRSWFEGETMVRGAKTEVVTRGPVFIEVKVTFDLADAQTYEARLRFVTGDPWVDVTENYKLTEAATYYLEFKDQLKPDTVMFVPWFSYERFGGNTDLQFTKLEPRPKQRGPFVSLRPRWTQAPGGGQEFFVTRGGPSPYNDRETKEEIRSPEYKPDAPAVGIVATHPIRWVKPYAQTIAAYAEGGDTARLKFPVSEGARAYAVVCGPRELFDGIGKMNGLVRRHTDWTLDKQMNEYVLEWKRDPAKAGPNIFVTKEELARLQRDYKSGKETPEMKILKEFIATKDELKGTDKDLLNLIIGEPVKPPSAPEAGLWLQRRYQDDFLNPTGRATRRLGENIAAADLFSDGKPIGGAAQAAIGYIFTDLDNWPGYHNGWGPGNPNFHTDKYMPSAFIGAAMGDHPHAKQWLQFALTNFSEDQKKVLLPPDGVGFECPGYSGYSLGLQMEIAKVFFNAGYGNPVAENPLFAKTGTWHRNLLTPFDVRLQIRHEAPVGDTHRWTSGANDAFGELAKFYKEKDPKFAAEMMAVWHLLRDQGMRGSLISDLVNIDQTIQPAPLESLDWGSRAYYGFGSIMRTRFGKPDETFVSFKAGPARGHYHNDELTYHYYGAGTPLSLDYNCSYHPRGDHAALHNSMTFGASRAFKHTADDDEVEAQEQIGGTARVGGFKSTPVADVVVAERTSESLTLSPIYPEDAKYQFPYPTRKAPVPITHRRYLMLVKHPAGAKLRDYLVVRDETRSADRQQLNIQLLAREVKHDGQMIRATGQWDTDAVVFLANPNVEAVTVGRWFYYDEHMSGPNKWPQKEGKNTVPADAAEQVAWHKKIRDTDGEALIPPRDWKEKWQPGEYQKWVKVETAPGTPMLWVLYPKKQGDAEPKFEALADGSGVRVSLGSETDEVFINTDPAADMAGQAVVKQGGKETVLFEKNAIPAHGEIEAGPEERIESDGSRAGD